MKKIIFLHFALFMLATGTTHSVTKNSLPFDEKEWTIDSNKKCTIYSRKPSSIISGYNTPVTYMVSKKQPTLTVVILADGRQFAYGQGGFTYVAGPENK